MTELENKILKSFIEQEGKEVQGLDLIVALEPDTWPDDFGVYTAMVMESKDNGRVWDCTCTKNGKVKNTIEL